MKSTILESVVVKYTTVILLATCLSQNSYAQQIHDEQFSLVVNKTTQQQSVIVTFVTGLETKIQAHWSYMDKVWSGMDYNQHNLILFKVNENIVPQEAWLLNTQGKRQLTVNEYKKLSVPNPLGYSEIIFEGKPSIAMSISDEELGGVKENIEQIYRTATHELVHFYYQPTVAYDENSKQEQVYPLETTPRLYRKLIYNNLIKAYEHPEQIKTYLGRAKYWQTKWKTEFRQEAEAIRSTDIDEGSARYIENVGYFVSKDEDFRQKRQEAANHILKDIDFISASSESYELGYVAGLLLDIRFPDWKANFYKNGQPPVDILLIDIEPIFEEADPVIKKQVLTSIDSMNQEIEEKLHDIIIAYNNPTVPYLSIDVTDYNISYMMEGSYLYKNQPVLIGYEYTYKMNNSLVAINGLSVLEQYNSQRKYILMPLIMKYKINNNILTVDSSVLKVKDARVEMTQHSSGRIIYLLRPNDKLLLNE